jgi:L-iditol 2-dehydrogenase
MAPATITSNDTPDISAKIQQDAKAAASANGQNCVKTSRPNPSLQATADHRLKLVEAPVPEPGHGEVLLHVKATGICG